MKAFKALRLVCQRLKWQCQLNVDIASNLITLSSNYCTVTTVNTVNTLKYNVKLRRMMSSLDKNFEQS